MNDRLYEALSLSEDVLKGLETETLTVSSACLRCLRIARLMNDVQSIQWLEYETTGYPRTKDGYISNEAFEIGCNHGRETFTKDSKNRQGFFQLAVELENTISSTSAALNTLTTNGVSLSGELVALAMRELTSIVSARSNALLTSISSSAHNISILKGQYYNYALLVNLELKFSEQAEDVFKTYRLSTDTNLLRHAPESLRRLSAAFDNLRSDNPESWAQSLSSCRRVFQEVSDSLFAIYVKETEDGKYQTKSGKELNVSGANYKNRLYAVIDLISRSGTNRKLLAT